MSTSQYERFKEQLIEFHTAFKAPIARSFSEARQDQCALRVNLISEEYAEYKKAEDRHLVIDGLTDTLYVVVGTAITVGIDPMVVELPPPPVSPTPFKTLFDGQIIGLVRKLTERVLCYRGLLSHLTEVYHKINQASVNYGFSLTAAMNIVHASNMTKLWSANEKDHLMSAAGELYTFEPSGFPDRYIIKRKLDGKIIKPPSFVAPDLLSL